MHVFRSHHITDPHTHTSNPATYKYAPIRHRRDSCNSQTHKNPLHFIEITRKSLGSSVEAKLAALCQAPSSPSRSSEQGEATNAQSKRSTVSKFFVSRKNHPQSEIRLALEALGRGSSRASLILVPPPPPDTRKKRQNHTPPNHRSTSHPLTAKHSTSTTIEHLHVPDHADPEETSIPGPAVTPAMSPR
jgi:hypothetical protein